MVNEYRWCVYKHTSPSGKYYIGITSIKPEYRWNHGKAYEEKDQKVFYNAIKKYGWDNFTHEILANNLGEKTAKNMEKDLIRFAKKARMSYNMTDGGDGALGLKPMLGKKHSLETRRKFSEMRKGLLVGEKNPMYGRHETNPVYGKYGKDHPASKKIYQYDIEGTFLNAFDSLTEAAKSLGLTRNSVTHITACAKGKTKTALSYIWRYNKTEKLDVHLSKQTIGALLLHNHKQIRQFDAKLKLDRDKFEYQKKKDKMDNDTKLTIAKMRPKTTSNNK